MKRVFIVEDHSLFRHVLAVMLGQHTDLKKSVHAGSLTEARQILGGIGGEIDLAIVDLDMPDGHELIRALRDAVPDVPVLAFTLGRNSQVRARALQAGADQVLSAATPGEKIVRAAKRVLCGR